MCGDKESLRSPSPTYKNYCRTSPKIKDQAQAGTHSPHINKEKAEGGFLESLVCDKPLRFFYQKSEIDLR